MLLQHHGSSAGLPDDDCRDATLARLEPVFSRLRRGDSSAVGEFLELTQSGATLLLRRKIGTVAAAAIAREILMKAAQKTIDGDFQHSRQMTGFILTSIREQPLPPLLAAGHKVPSGLCHILAERFERLNEREQQIVGCYFNQRRHPDAICEDYGITRAELLQLLERFKAPLVRARGAGR